MGGFRYTCDVDLTNVKKKNRNRYSWKGSIGKTIYFNFNKGNFVGELIIVGYEYKNDQHLVYLEYEGNKLKPINAKQLLKGRLISIMSDYYIPYRYKVGDTAPNDKNVVIIDRMYNRNQKYYKIKCLKCGFDGKEHYSCWKHKKEYWIREYSFKNLISCPCCSSRVIVPGINDVLTLHPDLSKYFCEPEKLVGIPSSSRKKFKVKCPDCGNKRNLNVATVVCNKKVPCICNDTISYPNKFAYYLFEFLVNDGQVEYHESEYSPDWAGLYRYDNYAIAKSKKYLVEMDGGLGHGINDYVGSHDIKGEERDRIKDDLAKRQNIELIRIDCTTSKIDYIKESILSSRLNEIFDLSNVSWNLLDEKATKNIYKEICLDYDSGGYSTKDLHEKYGFCMGTIRSVLKKGTRFGWCKYEGIKFIKTDDGWINQSSIDNAERNKSLVLEYCKTHDEYNGLQISKDLGISQYHAINALKELSNEGLIIYSKDFIKKNSAKKIGKAVCVYDMNDHFIKEYETISSCVRESIKDFGVQFNDVSICDVCKNKYSHHKYYKFKYKADVINQHIPEVHAASF